MTSSNRRQRQLARAKFERQQARRVEREDKARVRKDCGLCWTRDGAELVWASSAGARHGLDLIHWHAAR